MNPSNVKLAIDYLDARYREEQSRFDHFENKCSRFITFVTIIIAALTTITGLRNGEIFNPTTVLEWIILASYATGSLAIIASWGHALSALRIGDCSVMPKSRKASEYLKSSDEVTALEYIYKCYVDTLEKLSSEIDKKSRKLELAYSDLIFSAWCLGLVVLLIAIMEINHG